MSDKIDKEIEAIKAVLLALEPLQPDVRHSVLRYVIDRLNIELPSGTSFPVPVIDMKRPQDIPTTLPSPEKVVTIRDLKEEKQPKSAIEMAVLVAFYLSRIAAGEERKQTITTKDIEKYFDIAKFRLPSKPQFLLPNTRKAGYLDSAAIGEYKLNPVGYNLVVHSMPKITVLHKPPKRRTPAKKKTKAPKKATRKNMKKKKQ